MISFLSFGSEKISAIDIGHYAAKVVQLQKMNDDSIKLLKAGRINLPQNVINEGEIVDSSLVVRNLENLFNQINFKPDKAVTTVSCKSVIVRNISLPKMPEEELKEALKWEADDYLPYSVEEAVFDYIMVNKSITEDEYNLIMVAASRSTIDSYVSILEELYIEPLAVNVQGMALLSILSFQDVLVGPTAIIDIGASATQITIANKRDIMLSRTIDTGGTSFTNSIMDFKNIDFKEAEEEKKKID